MKGSSTHELINNLPELDDAKQTKDDIENHIANVESNKVSIACHISRNVVKLRRFFMNICMNFYFMHFRNQK